VSSVTLRQSHLEISRLERHTPSEGRILNRASRGLVASFGWGVIQRECPPWSGTATALVGTRAREVGASRVVLRGLRCGGTRGVGIAAGWWALVGTAANAAVLAGSASSQGWNAVTHDSDAVGRAGLRCGTDLTL
jgi:hypothetical protein